MLACYVLVGCQTTEAPVTREAVIGSYVYKSEDPEGRSTDHEWDHLTLQADGKYDLVQGGPTKPKSQMVGVWTLEVEVQDPEVVLDRSGYPVQIERNEIRLLIDNDVGIWYAKAK
jgi:hypothetical protein